MASGLSNPQGLAIDPSNNVYVADIIRRQVLKILPTGVTEPVAGTGLQETVEMVVRRLPQLSI